MRSRAAVLAACVACELVGGCAGIPHDQPRERPIDSSSIGLAGSEYAAPGDGWWQALGDPQLDRLVELAQALNPSMAGALARVRSAQAQSQAIGSTNDLQAALDGEEYRQRISENYIFPPPLAGSMLWQGRLGVNLAWNLDFWGRQAALIEQSKHLVAARQLEAAGTRLLVSSAVTQAYVEFARARALEAIAGQAAVQRQRLADLTGQRMRAGIDTSVELLGAEGGVARVAVEREQARLAQEAAVHALAALTGRGAEAYASLEAPALDFERAFDLPQTLPVDLLAHRPDAAAARARVQAVSSGREAAVASFYPNVNLYAFVGTQALGLDELLDFGSRSWSAGPAIHLPLFDGGRLAADYHRAGAETDEAVAAYNETVLRAVREVADQLARIGSLERQLADQRRALESFEGAYRLAEQRYEAGLANYLTVLNAETQVLEARRQRVNLLADRTLARVALLVALGGDFQEAAR